MQKEFFFQSEVLKLFKTRRGQTKKIQAKDHTLPQWVEKANKIKRSLLYYFETKIQLMRFNTDQSVLFLVHPCQDEYKTA